MGTYNFYIWNKKILFWEILEEETGWYWKKQSAENRAIELRDSYSCSILYTRSTIDKGTVIPKR